MNRAEIRSGRADLALDRGALRGDIRAESDDGELLTTITGATAGPQRRVRAEGAVRVEHLARWTGDTARDGNLNGRFTLDGAADSVGLVGLAGTITANGAVDSVRLDTLQIALSPEPRVLLGSPPGSPRSQASRSNRASGWHEAHETWPRPELRRVS